MRHCFSLLSKQLAAVALVAGIAAATPAFAQPLVSLGAFGTTDPTATTPVKTTAGKHSWHETSAPDKLISADIHGGFLTVDGLVMKAQLNYTIKKAGYLYIFIPGAGTAIVSLVPMTSAVLVKNAFHGSNLEFPVAGHTVALENDGNLLGSGKADAYVYLDTHANAIDRYPMVGFGMTTAAPYEWPYAAPTDKNGPDSSSLAPRLPVNVLPRVKPVEPASTAEVSSR
jgi:hypothetical protein